MLIPARARGFSIIELIIGMAIIAILLGLGVPAFSSYLQNTKLRSAAESFLGGVQRARTEAVQSNATAEIILTDADPISSNKDTTSYNPVGKNWIVRVWNATNANYDFKDGRSGGETGTGVSVNGGTTSRISFNGLGAATNGSATISFTNPTGGTCASVGGPMRCFNVVITPGGQSRLCDTAVTAASGDTRTC